LFLNCIHSGSNKGVIFSSLLFNPYENIDMTDEYYMNEMDPDLNFYNEVYLHENTNCEYYDPDTLNDKLSCKVNNNDNGNVFSLSMCHLNIRSVKQNLNHFESYLQNVNMEFAFIGLSETWLTDAICDLYSCDGYNLVEKHRSIKKGGGVGILIKSGISYSVREDLSPFNEYIETIAIELYKSIFGFSRNIVIAVLYRAPNTDTRVFLENIEELVSNIHTENKICYLMGDYNINLLNHDSHQNTSDFIDLMYSYSFIPTINRPTRVNSSTATLIDNIFTNYFSTDIEYLNGIFLCDTSDHFPIFHINFKCVECTVNASFIKRNYSMKNKLLFKDAISKMDLSEMYIENDAQLAFTWFNTRFRRLYDTHFPTQTIKRSYNNKKPWLTDCLKKVN
jgi:exonuclease III